MHLQRDSKPIASECANIDHKYAVADVNATTEICSNPFFIVGSGRSGSTLLRLILNRHPNVCVPPESWFMLPLLEQFPINMKLDSGDVIKACETITTHKRWADFDIDAAVFSDRLISARVASTREISDVFFSILCARAGKPRWGDKTPPYIRIVPELLRLYPEGKALYLVRDGRDVTNSFIDTRWHGPGVWANSREWLDSARRFSAILKRADLADRILRVVYEELVEDSENVIRNICGFLGEEYQSSMIDWDTEHSLQLPDRESHAHGKLQRRPRRSDLYRWERSSGRVRVFLLEAYMRDELTTEGYELRHGSSLWRPVQWLARSIAPIGARIYRSLVWRYRYIRNNFLAEPGP